MICTYEDLWSSPVSGPLLWFKSLMERATNTIYNWGRPKSLVYGDLMISSVIFGQDGLIKGSN